MLDGPVDELLVFRAEKITDLCHFKVSIKAHNIIEAREMLNSLDMQDYDLIDSDDE